MLSMMITSFLLVLGTFAALVGILLTDNYEQGSRYYKAFRFLAILGVLSLGAGLLMYLSQGFYTDEQQECDRVGGLYVNSVCLDDERLPIIPLGE